METRRISIDVPKDMFDRLGRAIPHGQRGFVFRYLVTLIDRAIEEDKEGTLTQLYSARLELGNLLPEPAVIEEEEKDGAP